MASHEQREGQWGSAEHLSRFMYEEIQLCRDRLTEARDVENMPLIGFAKYRPVICQPASPTATWCRAGSM
jgi:hypothetical protein